MVGPLVFGISTDPVNAAKVLSDFAKTNDKLVIKAGSYNGKLLSKESVIELASIPSKEVLLAQICGLLMSPMSGIARAVAAVAEQKSAGAAPVEAAVTDAPAPDAEAAAPEAPAAA